MGGFWVKTPWYMSISWHFTGIYRPLPVSTVLSEEQRTADCNFIMSVVKTDTPPQEERLRLRAECAQHVDAAARRPDTQRLNSRTSRPERSHFI